MRRALVIGGAVLLLLAVLPWLLPGSFYVAIATHVLVAAVLALSLDILIGACGMSSLGHAVYLGVPAYAYAWLVNNTGLGVPLSAVLAVGCGTLLAGGFGVLALRATGLGFLVFGTIPDRWMVLGAAIIMVSGVAVVQLERQRVAGR